MSALEALNEPQLLKEARLLAFPWLVGDFIGAKKNEDKEGCKREAGAAPPA
jgi:hypothetical protein